MSELMKQYGTVFLLSMTPLLELRGSIPAGIAMGLNPWAVWAVSVVGNILPAPFIILFIRAIFAFMRRLGGFFARVVEWLEAKAARGAQLFYRYELLGLFLLVAIPMPGTGAWTGALVAAMLDLRLRTAIPAIGLGVGAAGILMLILSYGVSILL